MNMFVYMCALVWICSKENYCILRKNVWLWLCVREREREKEIERGEKGGGRAEKNKQKETGKVRNCKISNKHCTTMKYFISVPRHINTKVPSSLFEGCRLDFVINLKE